MTKARQKGVRKVNEMKIKVRKTSGDHQGYIEWIKKFDFGNLPVEDRRTMNAPVARLEAIRMLLAFASIMDFKLYQMDVKSAFLNGFI